MDSMISPTPPAPFVDDEPREIEEPMQGQHFAGVAVAAAPPAASSEQHRPAPACSLYTTTQRELDEHPISPQNRSHTLRDPDLPSQIDLQPQIDLPITTARPPSPAMTDKIEKGDQVSWQWSGSRPGGEVAEVVEKGEAAVESKRGNTIKKNAEPDNPAVHITRPGNDVVKRASELDVEEKAGGGEASTEDKKDDEEEKKEENGHAQTGDKRKADEPAEENKTETNGDAKKQKTDEEPKENGEKAPKKKGRPAKNGANGAAPKKETKKREPKKAATETGEPRRSGRNKA